MFFHIVFEIIRFKVTFAIEQVYFYRKDNTTYCFVRINYPRNIEEHYLKIKNRYAYGKVKIKNSLSYYEGFVPYYIDKSINEIYIYNQKFKRLFGNVFYIISKSIRGFFIFDNQNKEIFCARLFNYGKGVNFKIISRISI